MFRPRIRRIRSHGRPAMGTVRAVQRVGRRWLIDLAVVPEIDAPFEAPLRVSAEGEEPRVGDRIALVHLDRRVMALEHPLVFRRPAADESAGVASTPPTGGDVAGDPLATLRLVFDALRAPDAHLPRIVVDQPAAVTDPPPEAPEMPPASGGRALAERSPNELLALGRDEPAAVAGEIRRRLDAGEVDRLALMALAAAAGPTDRDTIRAIVAALNRTDGAPDT